MLDIERLRQPRSGAAYRSPARVCLTADGRLVDCSDPAATTLLVGEGGEIPWDLAARYGLVADPGAGTATEKRGARAKRVGDDRIEDKGA